jgi:hypothetical protein
MAAYIDDVLSYSFDPDHAILAYPMLIWEKLRDQILAVPGSVFDEDEQNYLRSLFIDNSGALSAMRTLLRGAE